MEYLRIIGCAVLKKSPGNEFFSLDQVVEVTGLNRNDVRRTLQRLSHEKLVVEIQKQIKAQEQYPRGRPIMTITYHVADQEKLKTRVAPKLKEGTAQDRMWSVIRNKSKMDAHFTTHDVIILAEVGRENARWFLKMLRRAGIIQPSKPRGQGAYWTLVKDPGPKRPYVGDQKKKANGLRLG